MARSKENIQSHPVQDRRKAIIISVGEVNLIGIPNHPAMRRWGFHARRLKHIFRTSEHLLMEGSEDVIQSNFVKKPVDYEQLAASHFTNRRENVHCLESDVDPRPKTTTYGIDPSVVLAGMFFEGTKMVFEKVVEDELTDNSMRQHIREMSLFIKNESFKRSTFKASEIEDSINMQIEGILQEVARGENFLQILEKLDLGSYIVQEYLGKIRDYEEMGPRLAQLATELSGKKTVILGDGHIPAMKAALRGLPVRQPLPWDNYKETLDPKEQDAVVVFERVAQGRAVA